MKAELETLVDKYIASCEAKSALLSSNSENIRRSATLACLKATYCRHHRKELVDEMVRQNTPGSVCEPGVFCKGGNVATIGR